MYVCYNDEEDKDDCSSFGPLGCPRLLLPIPSLSSGYNECTDTVRLLVTIIFFTLAIGIY